MKKVLLFLTLIALTISISTQAQEGLHLSTNQIILNEVGSTTTITGEVLKEQINVMLQVEDEDAESDGQHYIFSLPDSMFVHIIGDATQFYKITSINSYSSTENDLDIIIEVDVKSGTSGNVYTYYIYNFGNFAFISILIGDILKTSYVSVFSEVTTFKQ